MIGYLVTTYTGVPAPGDDASDTAFFARNELPDIAFESHRTFIRQVYSTLSA